ncbi:hypothetical protein ACFL20_08855 [Spirochaetota bacterium]
MKELEKNKKSEITHGIKRTFGQRVQGRIDFIKERKVAKHLLNHEFDRAEDIIRKYVEDFNYKIILATFSVLSSESQKSRIKIDYTKFKVHHMDNYLRLKGKSALRNLIGKIKVEDDIGTEKKDNIEEDDNKTKNDRKTSEDNRTR